MGMRSAMYHQGIKIAMSQHGLVSTFRRQFVPFSVVFGIGIVATVCIIMFAPRRYQSNAKLLLKIGRENVSLDPTVTTTGETTQVVRTRDSEVNTALQAMSSRAILEKVVGKIGEGNVLRGSLAESGDDSEASSGVLGSLIGSAKSFIARIDPIDDRERAIIALKESLHIDARRESSVVEISYTAKSPELAQRVTDTWVQTYRSEHAHMNATQGSLQFFKDQEEHLLETLDHSRDELQSLKSKLGIVTVEGEQQILQSQMESARAMTIQSKAKLAAATARLASLEKLREKTSEKIVTSQAVTDSTGAQDRMRDRLFELEIEERRLAALLKPDHPNYKAVAEQLKEANLVYQSQVSGGSEVTEGINPLHVMMAEQWATEIANVEAYAAELKAAEESQRSLLAESSKLNFQDVKLAAMKRQIEVLENQYRDHYAKREQARIADALEAKQISNINLIQPASLERRPVSPNKKLCGLVGLFGSFLAALGFVTVREARYALDAESKVLRDQKARVETDEPIDQLPAPVVSQKPAIPTARLHSVPR